MRIEFNRQLNKLNMELTGMGSAITNTIRDSIQALRTGDRNLAQSVIENEAEIKNMAHGIENRCIKLLMKQQPVAGDLRLISSALKMVTDMERIGRQAADIAEVTTRISNGKPTEDMTNLIAMSDAASEMVEKSIRSFVTSDTALVDSVIKMDDVVDEYFNNVKGELLKRIKDDAGDPEILIDYLMIAKYFERIGDHAENIANWVNYSITGEVRL
ncbi:MAG: phosphate signaling complex protein PhoU [Tissierellia bacterium]|nr:phosphate signaling complex protein PhoU [Tissierellia bacterium]